MNHTIPSSSSWPACPPCEQAVLPTDRKKNEEDREREESKRDGVSVRKVSIFMVCFIKVTIIQWYIVLNSQKYEQIFTARHTHNGNTSLQNKLHTDGWQSLYVQTSLKLILFAGGGKEERREKAEKRKKKKKQKPPTLQKQRICSMKTKALREKWANTHVDYCKASWGGAGVLGKMGAQSLTIGQGWPSINTASLLGEGRHSKGRGGPSLDSSHPPLFFYGGGGENGGSPLGAAQVT